MVENLKWRTLPDGMGGIPVSEHGGIICTGEFDKSYVKLTFAKGASFADPARLFNASPDGGTRRASDIREGDEIDEDGFKAMIRTRCYSTGR